MIRRTPILAAAAMLAMWPGTSAGQLVTASDEALERPSTLHEHFDLSAIPRAGARAPARAEAAEAASTRAPGDPPELTLQQRPEEPVLGAQGPLSDLPVPAPQGDLSPLDARNKLDFDTDRVGELNYFAAFEPSVIPYKRVVAQNHVSLDPTGEVVLEVAPGRLEPLVVRGGSPPQGEDAFWGTFLVRVDGAALAPLPSVAPEQRIISLVTEPAVEATLVRDQAGNHYLRTAHVGLLRVNMRLSVPRYYFDGELDPRVSWSDFPRERLAELPAEVRRSASEVHAALGVSRARSPYAVMTRLIEHFRDFEGEAFLGERSRAEIYTQIALGKRGVCRHRSFAFMITANALGVPTRLVYNEAHAFVEIYWPGQGWRRVDLGGAADEVLMRAGQDTASQQRVHDGASRDPLPSPPAYTRELARLAEQDQARGTGEGDAAAGDAQTPGAAAATQPGVGDAEEVSGAGVGAPTLEPGPMSSDPRAAAAIEGAPGALVQQDSAPQPQRAPMQLLLSAQPEHAKRGERFSVTGRLLTMEGRPLAEREVRVTLAPVGGEGQGRQIGAGMTNAQGVFQIEAQLPAALSIGRWMVRVRFDGDAEHLPAEAR